MMGAIRLVTEVPGPRSRALMAERRAEVARGPFHATPVFVARAHGALLTDVDGNTLVDLAAGIGVVNTGHTDDDVVKAAAAQLPQLVHGSFNVTPYEGYVRLCARLNRATPGAFAKKSFLANSGAEAVENAVKIARATTGRAEVIAFEHAFHGRTYLAMTLTAKDQPYRAGFGPLVPGVHRAPFPYAYRWPTGREPERVTRECADAFDALLARLGAAKVAAVIIEPVLGEGGFVPAPPAFLAHLRARTREHGIVLIADEIQTGFGRTGTLFACEQLGLEPDLLLCAKGLGGGLPISAVVGKAELMDGPQEGGIGGTFGGNPVACAAALAVLDHFERGDLLARARRLGETLRARLQGWPARFPAVGEVRGLGPMLAAELVKDRDGARTPAPEHAKALVRHACERGVVVMTAGTHGNVVRLLPPLVIEPGELDEALGVLEDGLKTLGG
jgi:4-aminobutyrate aminotransferase/(S)-3-amino-2-methylpropionate transaminase